MRVGATTIEMRCLATMGEIKMMSHSTKENNTHNLEEALLKAWVKPQECRPVEVPSAETVECLRIELKDLKTRAEL